MISTRLPMRALLVSFAIAASAAGCGGGGGDEGHTSASGPGPSARTARPPSTAFVPSSGGGGGGGFSGGGEGGFGSTPHRGGRIGGIGGGAMRSEEMRRLAAIERAHRPPGPVRLTGEDEEEQRQADWDEASRTRPISSTDADACQRSWDQHVATTEAYHTRRHDGLHAPISAAERNRFLASCRSGSQESQDCADPAYLTNHMDECQEVRDREAAAMRRRTHPTGPEPEAPEDPLSSFDDAP